MTVVYQLLHSAFLSNRLHIFLCTQWLWKTFPSAEHGWAPSQSSMYFLLLPSSALMLLGINWSLKPWFKLRDKLQWEKVVWVISWGYTEGRGILRKLHPSVFSLLWMACIGIAIYDSSFTFFESGEHAGMTVPSWRWRFRCKRMEVGVRVVCNCACGTLHATSEKNRDWSENLGMGCLR